MRKLIDKFMSLIRNENPYPKMGEVKNVQVTPLLPKISQDEIGVSRVLAQKGRQLSKEAIEAAKELELPTNRMMLQYFLPENQLRWRPLFSWYNKYIHKGSHQLGMGCRPCYHKVYAALKAAKA